MEIFAPPRDNGQTMTSQAFLWMNAGIALALAGLFFFGRWRERDPVRLRLRGSTRWTQGLVLHQRGFASKTSEGISVSVAPKMKNLNVVFIYNGHSFDAYEVFGVPAGASIDLVKAAYFDMLGKCDPRSRDFFETAYQVIKNKI
jgi:DnaJ-domain-containing protein 1